MFRLIFLAVFAILEVGIEPDTAAVKVCVTSSHHFLRIINIVIDNCSIEILTTCRIHLRGLRSRRVLLSVSIEVSALCQWLLEGY